MRLKLELKVKVKVKVKAVSVLLTYHTASSDAGAGATSRSSAPDELGLQHCGPLLSLFYIMDSLAEFVLHNSNLSFLERVFN